MKCIDEKRRHEEEARARYHQRPQAWGQLQCVTRHGVGFLLTLDLKKFGRLENIAIVYTRISHKKSNIFSDSNTTLQKPYEYMQARNQMI
jgi:hypothetical protein